MFEVKHCQLSFVIPIYNEAKRLPKSLNDIQEFSKNLSPSHEWIFVIEPSSDDSLLQVQNFCQQQTNCRWIHNDQRKGKGFAVQNGMLAAKGEWVFFMDADLSTPLVEISHFLDLIAADKENTQIWIGSRKVSTSKVIKTQGPLRQVIGKSLNLLLKTSGLLKFNDTQCGFKAFHQSVIPSLFYPLFSYGFSFDVEILVRAHKLQYTTKEIAVDWYDDEASSVRPIADSLVFLRDLIRIYYSLNKESK